METFIKFSIILLLSITFIKCDINDRDKDGDRFEFEETIDRNDLTKEEKPDPGLCWATMLAYGNCYNSSRSTNSNGLADFNACKELFATCIYVCSKAKISPGFCFGF